MAKQDMRSASLVAARMAVRFRYYTEPQFLVLGAQKAGTSWLHRQLETHPETCAPRRKELHFFDHDAAYRRGRSAYRENFPLPHVARGRVAFETTPAYLYCPKVPARLHAFNPDLKMIAILREPVERAYSAWNMYREMITDTPEAIMRRAERDHNQPFLKWVGELVDGESEMSFEAVVESELRLISTGELDQDVEPSLIRRGFYDEQIERYLGLFDQSQLLVLEYGEVVSDVGALDVVTDFLGLSRFDWGPAEEIPVNAREYDRTGDRAVRERLHELYEPHNERLARLLGRSLPW